MKITTIAQLKEFGKKHNYKIVYRTKRVPCDFCIYLYDQLNPQSMYNTGFDGYFDVDDDRNWYKNTLQGCIDEAIDYIKRKRKIY